MGRLIEVLVSREHISTLYNVVFDEMNKNFTYEDLLRQVHEADSSILKDEIDNYLTYLMLEGLLRRHNDEIYVVP